ncbi:MAG: hypothetical protein ACRDVL_05165, partial [Acidimicrobiia bacterium]
MHHWLKRVLIIAALASGALMITAGAAQAVEVPTDPKEVVSQTQEATNTNETNQSSDANAETNQTNVNQPVTVLSKDSGNG